MKSLLVCLGLWGLFALHAAQNALSATEEDQPELSRDERSWSGKCSVEAARTLSRTSCCGNLTDWKTYYVYKLSAYELSGQCCRDVLAYKGTASFAITTNNLRTNFPGSCFCDSTATECHDADRDPCLKNRERLSTYYSAQCGNVTFGGYRGPYSYNASLQERTGRCCRLNAMADGEVLAWDPYRIPGQCYCQPITTTTTTSTLASTTPAPTTAREPALPPTVSSTAPGTVCTCGCTCTSVIPACNAAKTTTATSSATTIIPALTAVDTATTSSKPVTRPPRLCQVYNRSLDTGSGAGAAASGACNVTGLVVFVSADPDLGMLCHGVYVYDPSGSSSNQAALYIPNEIFEAFLAMSNGTSYSITGFSDSVTFDWKTQVVAVTPETVVVAGVTSHVISGDPLRAACSGPACVYDSSTMSAALDLAGCALYTYVQGSSDWTAPSWVLNRSPVVRAAGCTVTRPSDECWAFVDENLTVCISDTGAPVYCPLSTGEMVVYGLVAFFNTCGNDHIFAVSPL